MSPLPLSATLKKPGPKLAGPLIVPVYSVILVGTAGPVSISCAFGMIWACVPPLRVFVSPVVSRFPLPVATTLDPTSCGSQSKTRTLKCADPNGFSRSPERPFLHYVVVSSPIPSKPQTPSRCLASPPSISLASTQPPYSTSMPQSGRRPQHQKQTCASQKGMSALPPIATAKADTRKPMSALPPIAECATSMSAKGQKQSSPSVVLDDEEGGRPMIAACA